MSTPKSVAIVGASIAGVTAANTLRQLGFEGEIHLFDADPRGAYERPPLSKAVLMDSDKDVESIALLTPEQADKNNITCHWGTAITGLDSENLSLETANSGRFQAGAIVLATGGYARKLPLPGIESKGVFVLRDFSDAEDLRKTLKAKSKVAVIGGGFIGAETVASLSSMGHRLTWIDAAPEPLSHVLPKDICTPLLAWYREQGVEIIVNARIKQFVTSDDQVTGIEFNYGQIENVDAVVMGVGMAPRSELAEAAGLTLTLGGIQVDEQQQTSAEGVFACGDVAVYKNADGEFQRDEHWQAAEYQGANAARAILNEDLLDKPVEWFWSDQGPHHIEMAGHKGERTLVRHEDDWPITFEFNDDRLVGVVSVNNPNAVRIGLRLIRQATAVDEHALVDTTVNLRNLLKRQAAS
jgi:3-phenylpropionate/trans-cinnamate dioxygenase ferredoxin reductase subunit